MTAAYLKRFPESYAQRAAQLAELMAMLIERRQARPPPKPLCALWCTPALDTSAPSIVPNISE
ncbi:MAG TPA: hypothetical protein VGJ20_46480 [Xanthobacteraceae bacterium]|jgi:hypothetical protein